MDIFGFENGGLLGGEDILGFEDGGLLGGEDIFGSSENGYELNGVYSTESDIGNRNISFEGYSQSEIDRHISDAESDKARYESLSRHHASLGNNSITNADAKSHFEEANRYEELAKEAEKEANKWRHTKPS